MKLFIIIILSFLVFISGCLPNEIVNSKGDIEEKIDLCKTSTNAACVFEPQYAHAGSCYMHFDEIVDACNTITDAKDVTLCYKLEKNDLIAYCLAKIDLDECYDYAKDNADIAKVCDAINCYTLLRENISTDERCADVKNNVY